MGVNKYATNNMVYNELGRYPFVIARKLRIFKYWLKLKESDNCILKACLADRIKNGDEWIINIKNELNFCGLGYLWDCDIGSKEAYSIIEQRIYDSHKQLIVGNINNSPKAILYRHILDNFICNFT